MPGHRPPPNLNRHDRGDTLQKRNHGHPQHHHERVLLLRHLAHARRQWSDQAVTQQNAQKSPHQSRRHLASNFFRRSTQRAHRDHHPQHRRHNTQPGQRVRHRAQRCHRLARLVMMDFHIRIQHLIQIEYLHAPAYRHSHGVADESHGVVVLHKILVIGEQRAFVRILDIRLQGHQAFLACLLQKFIHHLQ